MQTKNLIVDKSLDFSVEVIKFCELLETQRKYVIAKQFLHSCTSIGANVFEAQHAESKADFIHKMKIAIKEVNETLYWLLICEKSDSYPTNTILKSSSEELIRIISKITFSSKNNPGKILFFISTFFATILLKIR